MGGPETTFGPPFSAFFPVISACLIWQSFQPVWNDCQIRQAEIAGRYKKGPCVNARPFQMANAETLM